MTVRTADTTYFFDVGDTTLTAPLQGGWAWPDSQVGVPSAVGVTVEGYGEFEEFHAGADTLIDSLSNVHVVTYIAPAGSPPSVIRHFVNGDQVSERVVLWAADHDGNWVMTESVLEVYTESGDTVSTWTAHNGQIVTAGGHPLIDALRNLAVVPTELVTPRPLHAQWSCAGEWLGYLGASAALDIAIGFVLANPNPLTVEAFLGAAAAWGATLDNLVDCMVENG